jgi:DNA repair protein RadC
VSIRKHIGEQSGSSEGKPSEDGLKLTERLVQAGEIVGIDVLDHIIIGDKDYLSLKSKGLF